MLLESQNGGARKYVTVCYLMDIDCNHTDAYIKWCSDATIVFTLEVHTVCWLLLMIDN
jgi:hypothetical protein